MSEICEIIIVKNKKFRCYFDLCLQIIGGKWKPMILYHLSLDNILRFGELRRKMPDITERMLTKQFRELEADGVINRKVYQQVPPKVEYSLKTLGKNLIPILAELREWGEQYEKYLLDQ